MIQTLTGTPQHKQILQTIVDYYTDDERILSVVLFGSLARGNWDTYSDLDLDIVLKDGVSLDVGAELKNLCEAIQAEHGLPAIIIPYADEGDVVLSNLIEFSIRYHPLDDTKSAILDSMQILMSKIPHEHIQVAGELNQIQDQLSLTTLVNQCVRYTVELHNAIARENLWMALELGHRIQSLLMQLFAISHGEIRHIHFFEANANPDLQTLLKRVIPQPNFQSLKTTLNEVIKILESELVGFSKNTYQLTTEQQLILQQLKQKL